MRGEDELELEAALVVLVDVEVVLGDDAVMLEADDELSCL